MAQTKEVDGVIYTLEHEGGILAGGQKWVWRSADGERTIDATEEETAAIE